MKNFVYLLITIMFISSCDVPQRNRFIQTPAFNGGNNGDSPSNQSGGNNVGSTTTQGSGTPNISGMNTESVNADPINQNGNNTDTSSSCNLRSGLSVGSLGNFQYCKDMYNPTVFKFRMQNNPTFVGNYSGICFAPIHINQNGQSLIGQIECIQTYQAGILYAGRYNLYSYANMNAFLVMHRAALEGFLSCINSKNPYVCSSFEQQNGNLFRFYNL